MSMRKLLADIPIHIDFTHLAQVQRAHACFNFAAADHIAFVKKAVSQYFISSHCASVKPFDASS